MESEASVIEIEMSKMEDIMYSETPQPEKDANNVDKVRKRRSSIFQNKSTAIVNNADEEIVDTGICQEWESTTIAEKANKGHERHLQIDLKDNSKEEEFDLVRYVNSLKEERKLWVNIVKERKSERQKLMKKKIILEREGQPLDLNQLSDEERAFVQESPNYQQISDECSKLTKQAVKIAFLNELVGKLNTDFISRMTKELGSTTKQIIQILEE